MAATGRRWAGWWWPPHPLPVWSQQEEHMTASCTGWRTTWLPPRIASTNCTQTEALAPPTHQAPPSPSLSTSCPALIQLLVRWWMCGCEVHVLIKWFQCSPTCLLLLGRKYIFLNYSDFSFDSEQTKPCFHENYPVFKTGPLTNRAIHSLTHQWPHFTIINNKIPNNYCLSGANFYSLFHVCRSE